MEPQIYQIPPPELVQQWCHENGDEMKTSTRWYQIVATKAAQWGADRELEACCEWFICDWTDIETADKLRTARRPKPPSLKEQALRELGNVYSKGQVDDTTYETIANALEALPE